jgi:fused signal recognition particle receptor
MARLFNKSDAPKRSLWDRVKHVALLDVGVLVRGGVSEGSLESLEQLLIESDFGVPVTMRLVDEVRRRAARGEIKTDEDFRRALADGIEEALRAGSSDVALASNPDGPTIVLVVGINGAGKTTFIGKLSERLKKSGRRVMIAAGDTFRAGAIDQLRVWAERAGAEFIDATAGADPASVAFDAVDAAVARKMDVLIIDTAGRLHTSDNLMEELRKVARVVTKRMPGAPHETLLVLDGTIGQNAIQQAKSFSAAVPVTGLVVTKLDGTARGGVVVAAHEAIDVPVKFLGTGEGKEDLVVFDAADFAAELLR